MQAVRLSVIIPSTDRPTLARAVASAEGADEILIDINDDGDKGYSARHRLMAKATGTHLCFLDDDDIYTEDAIEAFREHACDRPVIAQMRYPAPPGQQGASGYVLWKDRIVRHGNVGSPMLLVPNVPDRLGTWREHQKGAGGGGDYTFAAETISLQGPPVWVPHVVAVIRPP